MFLRDLLVATISLGLGLSMIRVAAINRGWWFGNFIVRNIEETRGRGSARKSLYIGGAVMVLIGLWTLASPWLRKEAVSLDVPQTPPFSKQLSYRS